MEILGRANRGGVLKTPEPLETVLRRLWLAAVADAAGPSAANVEPALELEDALGTQLQRRLAELRERLAGGRSVQTLRRLRRDLQAAREAVQAATHRHEQAQAALREGLKDGATDKAVAAREKRSEAAAELAAAEGDIRMLNELLHEAEAAVREESRQAIESLKGTLLSEAQQASEQAIQRMRGMIQAKAFQKALHEFNIATRMASLATKRPTDVLPAPLQLLGLRWWSLEAALRDLGSDDLAEALLAE